MPTYDFSEIYLFIFILFSVSDTFDCDFKTLWLLFQVVKLLFFYLTRWYRPFYIHIIHDIGVLQAVGMRKNIDDIELNRYRYRIITVPYQYSVPTFGVFRFWYRHRYISCFEVQSNLLSPTERVPYPIIQFGIQYLLLSKFGFGTGFVRFRYHVHP